MGLDKFSEVFPSILAGRDPCFADILGIELSKEARIHRTYLFFRDAFKSDQKASVENINKTPIEDLLSWSEKLPKELSIKQYIN